MISREQFYGGSYYALNQTSLSLPVNGIRFIRAVGFVGGTWIFRLPAASDITPGGPIYVISNAADTADIGIYRDDNIQIGTIPSSSTGFVFLVDSEANGQAGAWYLGGNGTDGEVGEQEDSTGFFYGTSPRPSGLETNLGSADDTPDQAHLITMDFGGAVISVPPSIII